MADWSILGAPVRPVIRTERLVLDTPRESDIETIAALANDFEVARWLGRLPHPYGRADAEFFIAEVMPRELSWAIRPGGGALAGLGGLMPREDGEAEIGYWLGRPHQGRGYGSEAVRAIVDFGIRRLGLRAIRANVFDGNVRSLAILRGAGFREVGRSERDCLATGAPVPAIDLLLEAPRPAGPPERSGRQAQRM